MYNIARLHEPVRDAAVRLLHACRQPCRRGLGPRVLVRPCADAAACAAFRVQWGCKRSCRRGPRRGRYRGRISRRLGSFRGSFIFKSVHINSCSLHNPRSRNPRRLICALYKIASVHISFLRFRDLGLYGCPSLICTLLRDFRGLMPFRGAEARGNPARKAIGGGVGV